MVFNGFAYNFYGVLENGVFEYGNGIEKNLN